VRLRGLGLGAACVTALVVAVALLAPTASTGCTTHQCDPYFFPPAGTPPPTGDVQMLYADTGLVLWESNPEDSDWYDFPGQETYFFELPPGFQLLDGPYVWVSIDQNPEAPDAGGNLTPAAGQLAYIANFVNGGFEITNATCAEYYLRVSALGTIPVPPPPAPIDAGDDASTDAPTDVPVDASGDGDAGAGD
jgi:hypothetical protein